MNLTRCPKKEATIEEISTGEIDDIDTGFLLTENDIPKVKGLSRLEIDVRRDEISEVLNYNVLKRDLLSRRSVSKKLLPRLNSCQFNSSNGLSNNLSNYPAPSNKIYGRYFLWFFVRHGCSSGVNYSWDSRWRSTIN